ncbi:hypothetical protein ZOSMA_96G00520 [Zostera marina]|uniref:Homeobox domain-containing protein n=1 Tax=Zostera marina TaxID=29655 RepID=A0A0K9NHX7_ZOSMR|nr:hypothetical protein ZOSMA_96G00520 [Zostera marina]
MMYSGSRLDDFDGQERRLSREVDTNGNQNSIVQYDPMNSNEKKRNYHRHSHDQIQNLEAIFKDCANPNVKQRVDLGKKLNMDSQQVRFWFQNKRTKVKNQIKNKEISILRQQIEKLQHEKMLLIMESMSKPCCSQCGYHPANGKILQKDQEFPTENDRSSQGCVSHSKP